MKRHNPAPARRKGARGPVGWLFAVAAIVSCDGLGAGAENVVPFLPAAFTNEPKSLQNRIVFPKVEGDVSITILCDALVSTTGLMGFNRCFAEDNRYIKYETAIHRGINWAWLRPAEVDGHVRKVLVPYAVVFERKDGKESIRVLPHHFRNVRQYGHDYSGPQRYGETGAWRGCPYNVGVWISLAVDENGMVTEAERLGAVDRSDERAQRCVAMVLELAASGRYIPAMHDGKAVPSLTYEYWTWDMIRPRS